MNQNFSKAMCVSTQRDRNYFGCSKILIKNKQVCIMKKENVTNEQIQEANVNASEIQTIFCIGVRNEIGLYQKIGSPCARFDAEVSNMRS